MRQKDEATGRAGVDVRPRYAVWENVPGAFSSHGGEDFQAVLQALAEVADPDVSIPLPDGGKWLKAGCIVGEGYSIAWRVYDAQYWGVPQRRKRIYLVADFGSERAGEVLFEPESLRGDSSQGGTPWQRASSDAQGCADGGSNGVAAFMGGQGEKAGGIAYSESVSPTLKASLSGGNTAPDIVYTLEGHCIDRNSAKNGKGWAEGYAHTLNATDRHGVVYPETARTLTARHDSSPCADRGQNVVALDCRNLNGSDVSGTLQAKSNGGYSLNYQNPVVYDTTQITSPTNRSKPEQGDPCHTLGADQHPPLLIEPLVYTEHQYGSWKDGVGTLRASGGSYGLGSENVSVYPSVTGALCANSHPGSYTGQDAFNGMLPVQYNGSRYVVRRLTPLECCRLQGYPDGWTENLAIPDPTIEEVEFFTKVWSEWAKINGKKAKNRKQVIKWLANPNSDSAEYKAYGNSVAVPCSYDVLRRCAHGMEADVYQPGKITL